MPDLWFAVPGDPATLTGGYIYARKLMDALPAAGWTPRLLSWPDGFPYPSGDDLETVRASLDALPSAATVLIDGLAYGTLPPPLLAGRTQRLVALVHHPLALESGLARADAERLAAAERAALAHARAVVAASPATARTLAADYAVPADRLHVAVPGTARAARAAGSGAAPFLLTVGTLTPRKGHDVLVRALARLADLPWTAAFVGSRTRDPATAANIAALIAAGGLQDRIACTGEMSGDALAAMYDRADLFVLSSRHEGYGMVFAEALARGLPVVGCAAGAVSETVPPSAGLLVPPDDVDALADALRRVLADADLRRALGDAAWAHGRRLPTWDDTARAVAAALHAAGGAA